MTEYKFFEDTRLARITAFRKLYNNLDLTTFDRQLIPGFTMEFPVMCNHIASKNRSRNLIRPPFSNLKNKKYRFNFNGNLYELYKSDYSFQLLKSDLKNLNPEVVSEFKKSYYYSIIFCMTYDILKSMCNSGIKVKLIDNVYKPIFQIPEFNSDNPDAVIQLDWFNRSVSKDKNFFYLSIF